MVWDFICAVIVMLDHAEPYPLLLSMFWELLSRNRIVVDGSVLNLERVEKLDSE